MDDAGKPRPRDLPFYALCSLFDALEKQPPGKKRPVGWRLEYVKKFIARHVRRSSGEAFDVFRLVLPELDNERGNSQLLQQRLADALVRAAGAGRGTDLAARIGAWRAAGDYPAHMLETVYSQFCRGRPGPPRGPPSPDDLRTTVGDVNALLDGLAAAAGRLGEQATLLRRAFDTTTPRQMFWITQLVLKKLKIKTGERSVFRAWHADAEDRFNQSGMSLRAVFNDMRDAGGAYRADVAPGRAVRPQMAAVALSPAAAYRRLAAIAAGGDGRGGAGRAGGGAAAGGEAAAPPAVAAEQQRREAPAFVIEQKFDGERIQVHVCPGGRVLYFSRKAIEHGEQSSYSLLDGVVLGALRAGAGAGAAGGAAGNAAAPPPPALQAQTQMVLSPPPASQAPEGLLPSPPPPGSEGKGGAAAADGGDAPAPCILDGELVVWNRREKRFEPFGSIKPTVSAALAGLGASERLPRDSYERALENAGKEGGFAGLEPPAVGDLELMYVAFDVLYVDGRSVMHEPLERRQARLAAAVREHAAPLRGGATPVRGRVVPLLPGRTRFGGPGAPPAARLGRALADVEAAAEAAARAGDEGVVLKPLAAPWQANNRHLWLKIKPDYVAEIDLDCLVVGGFYGASARGRVSSYLLALRCPPGGCAAAGGGGAAGAGAGLNGAPAGGGGAAPAAEPASWVTFARAGAGLADAEKERLHAAADWVASPAPPPALAARLRATGRERPDVWVRDPERGAVLRIHADLRIIPSNDYASGRSVRFPRITALREDKAPALATGLDEVEAVVEQAQAEAAGGGAAAGAAGKRRGARRAGGAGAAKRPRVGAVVGALAAADVSGVVPKSEVLKGCLVYFCDYGEADGGGGGKAALERRVAALGGATCQTYNAAFAKKITHVLGSAAGRGARRGAAPRADGRPVLSLRWLDAVEAAGRLLPPRPRHYVSMGLIRGLPAAAAQQQQHQQGGAADGQDADEFGDPFFSDADEDDVAVLLGEGGPAVDAPEVAARLGLAPCAGSPGGEAAAARAALEAFVGSALAELGGAAAAVAAEDGLLRGCTVVVVQLQAAAPGPAAAAGGLPPAACRAAAAAASAAAAAVALRARRLAARVRLHGGRVAAELRTGGGATHVVLVGGGGDAAAPLEPAAVLAAVSAAAGGPPAVAALRAGLLQGGGLALVCESWLEETFAALDGGGGAGPSAAAPAVTRADEGAHTAEVAAPPGAWPWAAFEPPPPPPPPPSRAARRAGAATAGEVVVVEARPRRAGRATAIRPASAAGAAPGVKAEDKPAPAPPPPAGDLFEGLLGPAPAGGAAAAAAAAAAVDAAVPHAPPPLRGAAAAAPPTYMVPAPAGAEAAAAAPLPPAAPPAAAGGQPRLSLKERIARLKQQEGRLPPE